MRARSFASLALALLFACRPAPSPPESAGGDGSIAVTFFPLAEFTRALVGDERVVHLPLPQGADPSLWQPDREALEVFRRASLVVSNGASFERWLDHASLPDSRHVRTADGFRAEWIEIETRTHSHGAGEHTHQGVDGHTWLDPVLARRQAEAIAVALLRGQEAGPFADRVARGLEDLRARFNELDERLAALTPRLAGVDLFASHAAYDYLARRYGWSIESVEPADLPSQGPRPLLMLWEGEPWETAPARATHVTFFPGENPPPAAAELGYFGLQVRNLDALEAALDDLGL